jgi:ABC-2 type transport system permease protein
LNLSTSIADSALSRDAHALAWIKSLPISARQYFGAKILHAEIFSVASCLVGVAMMRVFLPVAATDILIGLGLALVASFALNMGGLWLDVAFPRLKWNNPIAALKQNPNVVIWLFAGVALLFGLGYLCTVVALPRYGYALGLATLFVLADLALWIAFDRWSATRYRYLEA